MQKYTYHTHTLLKYVCTHLVYYRGVCSMPILKLPYNFYYEIDFAFCQSSPCPSLTLQPSTISLFAAILKRMKSSCLQHLFLIPQNIIQVSKREIVKHSLLNLAGVFFRNLGAEPPNHSHQVLVLLHMIRCKLLTLICIFSCDQWILTSKHCFQ